MWREWMRVRGGGEKESDTESDKEGKGVRRQKGE